MTRRFGVALALCISGAGCGTLAASNDGVNPEVPLWYNRPGGALHTIYTRPLTATSRKVGEEWERGQAEIDPANDRIFIGSADHGLYALRSTNGATLWRFETLGVVQSEPLYDAELDYVYFGSHDGALYCVRALDGSLVWRFDTGAEVARKPVRVGETLYFANGADTLLAVDRRSGKETWRQHRTPALGMEVSGYAGPAYDRGLVFMAYSDGHVVAYDARDGNERWTPVDLSAEAEQNLGAEGLRYLDVDTTPVPDDLGPQGRVVYVASYTGGVFALDQERGAPVWRNEKVPGVTEMVLWREPAHRPNPYSPQTSSGGAPMVPGRKILLASGATSGLWALDPNNGRPLWRVPVPEGGITAPVPVAGALAVGSSRYGLFLLSPINGRRIDGIDVGSGFSETPAAYGTRVFELSNAGTLVAFDVVPPIVER
jgi:outer membrane protein assembly factor BamB